MHRTSFPQKFFLFLVCGFFAASTSPAQAKPEGEVDPVKCWSYSLNDASGRRIASDGKEIVLGRDGGRVDALMPDGKKVWSGEFGGEISSNLLPGEAGLYFVTSTIAVPGGHQHQSILRVVSTETGITNWTSNLSAAESYFLFTSGGSLIVVSKSGAIQAMDAKSGVVRWKRDIANGFMSEPAFTADKLFVATTNKQVFGVSIGTGQIDSFRTFPNEITAIAAAGGLLIVCDDRGYVTVIEDGITKPRWRFRAGGEISSVVGLDDHLLVASHDNFVYFLGLSRGGLLWKKRLTGRVSYVWGSPGKYVLVASFEGRAILFLNAETGKVIGQIALGEEESLVSAAVSANGIVYTLSIDAVHSFAPNGCSSPKSDGPGKIARKPPLLK